MRRQRWLGAASAALLAVFLALWEWGPEAVGIPPYILPPASSVLEEFLRMTGTDRVFFHAAVTAGVTLTTERMNEVLALLWETANPSTCPHGRPTVLRLDLPFIERRFGRS